MRPRLVLLASLAVTLLLGAGLASAADDTPPEATGPTLTPAQSNVGVCDPAHPAARYLQVMGTGFDAWAGARLAGSVVDENGNGVATWKSIWVNPGGDLTLEVNVCDDPYLRRAALDPGDYVVSVTSPAGDETLAATTIAIGDFPALSVPGSATTTPIPALPTATAPPTVAITVPSAVLTPAATGAASAPSLAPLLLSPTPSPRTGVGSRQSPLPEGAPGDLGDGWQLAVTGVTPDAWTGSSQSFQPTNKGPANNLQYFLVRIQATYTGQGSSSFSEYRLALVGATTGPYTVVQNSCGAAPDELPPTLVSTGGVVRGNVCWAVRSTDVPSLVMYDQQMPEVSRLYFALR